MKVKNLPINTKNIKLMQDALHALTYIDRMYLTDSEYKINKDMMYVLLNVLNRLQP